ncbi:MAG: Integral membrane protein [Ktedonobacterales bacterium]|nr:MAG: Integral membrane protein [Ktedonobacterales bacterium]
MQLRDRTDDEIASGSSSPPGAESAANEGRHEPRGLYRIGFAYGRFIYKARWIVLALWVIGVAMSLPFAAKVPSLLTGGGYTFQGSDATRVSTILSDKFHQPPSQVLVVFQSTATPVSDPAYQAEVQNFVGRITSFPHVTSAQPAGVGQDGRTTYVNVNFNTNSDWVEHHLDDLRSQVNASVADGPARAYITGNPAVYETFNKITESDTKRAEITAMPIALLVLLVVFGTLVAAVMPLLLALVAVPVALALVYPIALHTEMSTFVSNVATIVGLGISIDYSLFMVRRFRDELAAGRTVRDAIGWTVATAGEAILFSGMTVMIGFCGLLLIGLPFMTSFGIGGAIVVVAAVSAALTLLPALLSILGHRINTLRLPVLGRLTMPKPANTGTTRGGFWQKWAFGVMRRPVLVLVLVCVVLAALGWPIFSLNIGTPNASSLPKTTEARQGLDILNAQFPETNQNPVLLTVQTRDGSAILTPANLVQVDALTQWVAAQQHVTSVTSVTRLPETRQGTPQPTYGQLVALYSSGAYTQNPALSQLVKATVAGDTTLISVSTNTKMDSPEGKALIDDLRAGAPSQVAGMTVLVGGFQATSLDFNRYLYGNFPKAILFILVATYILLLIMFRSVILPLKAVLMNVLSVTAAYGALIFIFQEGHFSNILGFTSDGFLDSTIPILLFCILFGLSMDYEVFLLSRIREEWLNTHNNRYAVARGLEKTGGVITNAALLFVIVTGAFTFTSIVITQEMGLGMTVAVLVDATIIRTLLVPATMRLLGRWNWWLPGRPLPPKQSA